MISALMGMNEFDQEYSTQPMQFVDREEIVDVLAYSKETRIPIPDRTYTQELLDVPIPLENRIAHLIPYIEPIAGVRTQYMISTIIGASASWVVRAAEYIGLEPLVNGTDRGSLVRHYTPPALELLQEEWDWYQSYKELDDQLTETAVGMFVAKSVHWVRKTAHELEVYPIDKVLKTGRERYTYKKTLIPQLRHILLVFLPAEDWCTKQELIELTGKDWPWIKKQLIKTDIKVMPRRSPFNGGVYDYIAPESREYLNSIKTNLPKAGKRTIHYSEAVRQPLEEKAKTEGTDKRLARIAIARAVGKSWDWVESRLPYVGIETYEEGSPVYREPEEEIIKGLKKIAEEEAADTRLAIYEIARILGHSSYWVKARLPFTTISPEEKRGKQYDVFELEIIDQLRALPEDIITMGPKPKHR